MSQNKVKKYVRLDEKGGMLFPLWIMENFKDYVMDELIETKEEKNKFTKQQIFPSKYLDYNSIYRDILLYHNVGTGKTAAAINIYNELYKHTNEWNVIILIKASLITNWKSEFIKFLTGDKNEVIEKNSNVHYITYDAPNAWLTFSKKMEELNKSKKFLYFIEEAHNFISNVYGNITGDDGESKNDSTGKALSIYQYIINQKKEKRVDLRVVMLTATPGVNAPFEYGIMFNLLRPGIFPMDENEFKRQYVFNKSNYTEILNPTKKNAFQRRIMGLVSYYYGDTKSLARKVYKYVEIKMSSYQFDIYTIQHNKEQKILNKSMGKNKKQLNKSYTRPVCNFVFPPISDNINGRTRPNKSEINKVFDIDETNDRDQVKIYDIDSFNESELKNVSDTKRNDIRRYKDNCEDFVNNFDDFLNIQAKEINNSLAKEIDKFIAEFNKDPNNFDHNKFFNDNNNTFSKLWNVMYNCSSKMLLICLISLVSKGPLIIYSNFVNMEGLQILKVYLKYFGYILRDDSSNNSNKYFMELIGGIDKLEKERRVNKFNAENNLYGDVCKIMLISSAAAEGINLRYIRQIHILEPHWNETRIEQIIGRGIRKDFHNLLPLNERYVDIYRYSAIDPYGKLKTSDDIILSSSRNKNMMLSTFKDAIKEAAVDCELFKNHNKAIGEYNCFKFFNSDYYNENVYPVYDIDIYRDIQLDNGSNSLSSRKFLTPLKVYKIEAIHISDINKENPPTTKYLFDRDSMNIYDTVLHFPLGYIDYYVNNNKKIPKQFKSNVYIVKYLIDIPHL